MDSMIQFLILDIANTLEKGLNPYLLSSTMYKIVGQTDSLVLETDLEKGKLNLNQLNSTKKLILCYIVPVSEMLGKYTLIIIIWFGFFIQWHINLHG